MIKVVLRNVIANLLIVTKTAIPKRASCLTSLVQPTNTPVFHNQMTCRENCIWNIVKDHLASYPFIYFRYLYLSFVGLVTKRLGFVSINFIENRTIKCCIK